MLNPLDSLLDGPVASTSILPSSSSLFTLLNRKCCGFSPMDVLGAAFENAPSLTDCHGIGSIVGSCGGSSFGFGAYPVVPLPGLPIFGRFFVEKKRR